jgi:hypothetical protein
MRGNICAFLLRSSSAAAARAAAECRCWGIGMQYWLAGISAVVQTGLGIACAI